MTSEPDEELVDQDPLNCLTSSAQGSGRNVCVLISCLLHQLVLKPKEVSTAVFVTAQVPGCFFSLDK